MSVDIFKNKRCIKTTRSLDKHLDKAFVGFNATVENMIEICAD